jgi:hypothetical protein
MKTLLLILPLLAIFSTNSKASGFDAKWYELVSFTTVGPFLTSSDSFNKEEAKLQIADDLAKYDLTGDMTQSLKQYILNAKDDDMTADQAVNVLEEMVK